MTPGTFVSRPVEVKAIRLDGDNLVEVYHWADGTNLVTEQEAGEDPSLAGFDVMTLNGPVRVGLDEWVIQGMEGEFYPCKHSVFLTKYRPVDNGG
jgi:hypothetical protein